MKPVALEISGRKRLPVERINRNAAEHTTAMERLKFDRPVDRTRLFTCPSLLPVAWLSETKDQLRRYAIGFAIMMLAGFSCFLLWPVAGPRPEEISNDPMYNLLVRYDRTLNSFPSLHMALATYSACVAVAITSGPLRRLLAVLLPVWVAFIGYATLATKQHYWVDLPTGILLGYLAQYLAWRPRRVKTRSAAFVDKRAA